MLTRFAPILLTLLLGCTAALAGEFTIKGLRFGQTLEEVVAVTGAKKSGYDTAAYTRASEQWRSLPHPRPPAPSFIDYPSQAPADDWHRSLNGFSIAGFEGWWANLTVDDPATLKTLYWSGPATELDIALERFTQAYGRPKQFRRYASRTNAGVTLNNWQAQWRVKDAVISMTRHVDRDTGSIHIEDSAYLRQQEQQDRARDQKARKDF